MRYKVLVQFVPHWFNAVENKTKFKKNDVKSACNYSVPFIMPTLVRTSGENRRLRSGIVFEETSLMFSRY